MVLDRTRDYGVVMGHPHAQYEQDGILFDAMGNPLGNVGEVLKKAGREMDAVVAEAEAEVVFQISSAQKFLRKVLAGGPVDTARVCREAELCGMDWVDVQRAFQSMGGTTFKDRKGLYWKLK